MNSSIDIAQSAVVENGHILIRFSSGFELRFPVAGNPRLSQASAAALSQIEISPYGLHWPKLDEDLAFAGILRGDFGQKMQVSPAGC